MTTWDRIAKHNTTWSRGSQSGVTAEIWSATYYPWGVSIYPWQNSNLLTETVWSRQAKH